VKIQPQRMRMMRIGFEFTVRIRGGDRGL